MSHRRSGCPVCRATRLAAVRHFGDADLVRCATCGFVCSGAIPGTPELERWYAQYPRCEAISPVTLARYDELLESFEGNRRTNRLFDLGCGNGHFLVAARDHGWTVRGTELSPDAVSICRAKGIATSRAPFESDQEDRGRFDVVTAFEVVEHLRDPRIELEQAASLLRPGGIVYVTTPNFDALGRRLLRERWRIVQYPEHLAYFSAETLDLTLRTLGLRRLSLTSTGASVDDLCRGAMRGRASPAGGASPPARARDETLRRSIQENPWLRRGARALDRAFTRLGVGDTLKATYRREP